MKTIQIDDDLYQFIAANTQKIGESASDILRRLLWEHAEIKTVEVTLKSNSEEIAVLKRENSAVVESKNIEEKNNEIDSTTIEPQEIVTPSVNDTVICKDTTVFNLLNKEEVATQKGAVGRFLFILSKLHRAHTNTFTDVLSIKGRERNYFGLSASELEASGSSIKPKQIPNSEYWVTTNNNTPRKKFIIFEVARQLGYAESDAEKLRELI